MKRIFAFVSSWNPSGVEYGIHMYELDIASDKMLPLGKLLPKRMVNMMTADRDRRLLYAVDGAQSRPEMTGGGGAAFVFKFDPKCEELKLLQEKETFAANPFYISIDHTRSFAAVAAHGGKSAITKLGKSKDGKYVRRIIYDDSCVELFDLDSNGFIGELKYVKQHYGSGPTRRQLAAHPHCIELSPDGKLAICCDKGSDTVRAYRLDYEKGELEHLGKIQKCPSGYMPRYCVFHPNKPVFYINGEGSLSVRSYRYDASGKLELAGFTNPEALGECTEGSSIEQQGLCISPNGRFLYDVCRGPNVVAVYEVMTDATLKLIQKLKVDDKWPRGLALSEDGEYCIITMMDKGRAMLCRIDKTGRLYETGSVVDCGSASNVLIWTVE